MEDKEKMIREFIDSLKLDYQYMRHIIYKMLLSKENRIDYSRSMRTISKQIAIIESDLQNKEMESIEKYLKMKKLKKYSEKRKKNGKR